MDRSTGMWEQNIASGAYFVGGVGLKIQSMKQSINGLICTAASDGLIHACEAQERLTETETDKKLQLLSHGSL